uniref:Uncharacterized protein n=1 Tax=Arundo donax TaxID=35708 RepID=A0A0A9FNN9_ARUDO
MMAAMTATATVCTGWKTAVKSGPPLSMHQICRANATPDATRPAYRMVNSSPPECTFHLLSSSSVKTAMTRNWSSPKMQVSDKTESLAGYLFSTGT